MRLKGYSNEQIIKVVGVNLWRSS